MKYITGIHALNLPCELKTTGDWHTSSLDWRKLNIKDSKDSVFGDYGIEHNKVVPDNDEVYFVANHIRAILDLLEEKRFDLLGNFKDDFVCNDNYTDEIFEKVSLLLPDEDIANYMNKIYGRTWRKWIKPLKVEMSSRKKIILEDEITKINGITVYNIDTLAVLKASAYQQRDKIRDLFDVTFIINNYYDNLLDSTKIVLQNALEYKGLDHFDYITHNQQDELIDTDVLAVQFLQAYEKVGLLMAQEEKDCLLEDKDVERI